MFYNIYNNFLSKQFAIMKFTFFLSIILIATIAHLIRIYRWSLFIKIYESPPPVSVMLRSLAFGSLFNIFIPFKLGDLFRAFYCGAKLRNGKSLGFSSVIIERILDILFVGFIFVGLFISDTTENRDFIFYIYLVTVIVILGLLLFLGKNFVKKTLKLIAGLFNQVIELKILKFSWALIRNFKDIATKINLIKLIASTLLMWGLYILSYFLFTLNDKSMSWKDMFIMLFSQNGLNTSGLIQFFNSKSNSLNLLIYLILPNLFLFVFSFFYSFIHITNNRNVNQPKDYFINLLPHINQSERLIFLENYFSGDNRNYIENYLKINSGISIIRDYSTGSNATTMLCMNSQGNFFRKYAFGSDGEKLYEQILWLKKFREVLPLPEILKDEKTSDFCYYDMRAVSTSVGLFEYAHSMPFDDSWLIIKSVIETLETSLYMQNRRNSDEATIGKYIELKVQKNIEKIQNARYLKPLMKYDELVVNGKRLKNLSYYLPMLSNESLTKIFRSDVCSEIHGDFTIENIICTRGKDGKDSWFIIDPNTGNIHDSPNLDYAKLLQSIAGGYEFLMRTQSVEIEENRVNFIFTKSLVYERLHEKFDEFMGANFSAECMRSIYYHHIVHWLRLMPYKIEKNGIRSVLFYAGLLMVLDEVEKKFGGMQ